MKTIKRLKTVLLVCMIFPASAQWTDQNSGITNDFEAVHFINDNEGWAVGRQGKIVHTTDAGANWTLQNSGTTNDLNDVFMVSSTCGYAVGDGGKTIKYNGTAWSSLSIGFSQDMFGVYFLSATQGWISGDWGRIMYTVDGGTTWTIQVDNSMYSNCFNDIHMVSASDGWAVGTSGRVLRYNGSTWSNVSNPASGTVDLYSVSMSSSGNGFMTGESSKVYNWDGSSWNEHSTTLPDNSFHVYSVWTVSNSLAYAACSPGFGGGGYILKYNGSTWSTSYNYTGMWSELFTGICFPSAGKGYCVASGGIIKTLGTAGGFDEVSNSEIPLNVYPNPFDSQINIQYNLTEADFVNLDLYDLGGKKINSILKQQLPAGNHEWKLDGSGLNKGVYFIKIEVNGQTGFRQVIK